MSKRNKLDPAECISPLYMNGLHGRILRMPPPKNKSREILLIYGHHASLERMFGLAEELNKYGGITMPDLPGFGGMEPFYKIGEKPTLDNMADYLAAFVKMYYKHRRVSILGMSYGSIVVTRMLQRNPELVGKVDLLVSIVGFAHRDDFRFNKRTYWAFRIGARIFSTRLIAWYAKTFLLRGPLIRFTYWLVADRNSKFMYENKERQKQLINFEVHLWKCNDIRTYMGTTLSMLKLDLCKQTIDLPVYHVAVDGDRYFNNSLVEQHMRVIFKDFKMAKSKMINHAPTVIASAKEAAPLIPRNLRKLLA